MKNNIVYLSKRISRIQKLKLKRRRRLSLIILAMLFIFVSSKLTCKLYRKVKCRDLQYAVEYQMTTGTPSEKLLRVQHITLIFNDQNNAVVEVSGLSKEKPHYVTTLKGTFKKASLNSWQLIHSEKS